MTKYVEWCAQSAPQLQKHSLQVLTANPGQYGHAVSVVANVIPDHYVAPQRVADLLTRLGRGAVAKYVAEKLPTAKAIRSGDLGEVLCSTYVYEHTTFKWSVKRLRRKDHRNMAMRGEDLLAFELQAGAPLKVLKAESKSRANMSNAVLNEARKSLSAFGELPSPHAMCFVADMLNDEEDKPLRDAIDDAQLKTGLKQSQVTHMLFSLSGNDATTMLTNNLTSYGGPVAQLYVGVRVTNHQQFIADVFNAVVV